MSLTKTVFCLLIITMFLCGDVIYGDEFSEKDEKISEINGEVLESGSDSQQSQVFKDPDTGEFITREEALKRGIIEELESLIFVPDSVQEEIAVEPLENGGFKAELPSTYNHRISATVNDKGEINSTCNHK